MRYPKPYCIYLKGAIHQDLVIISSSPMLRCKVVLHAALLLRRSHSRQCAFHCKIRADAGLVVAEPVWPSSTWLELRWEGNANKNRR